MSEQRKRRRWPWIVLGVLVLLILIAALALPALLEPERFRGRIEAALQSATGWEAELGDLDVSLTRGLALTVQPGSLRAPGDSSRFDIETLAVHAELWPLLRGELIITSIELIGPEILLVRADEAGGWALPIPPADDQVEDAGTRRGLDVSIDRIGIERGRLVVDDRVPPGQRIEFRDVEMKLNVLDLTVDGSASLGEDAGTLGFSGPLQGAIDLELSDLRTEFLHPWLGKDLLRAGGRLSGPIVVEWPEIRGELTGRNVTLIAGERPFAESKTTFEIGPEGETLQLRRLDFAAGGARITASGSISPDLSIDLVLPPTPLQTTLEASKSVVPLPLDLRPPGQVEARIDVDMPAGGALTYAARGQVSAAEFGLGQGLPTPRDVRAGFSLNRRGVLEVTITDGTVAGGKIEGKAWVEPVYPAGKLRFEGGLKDAGLGQLLDGFIARAGKEIGGPTALRANVGLNLTQELNARALGGQIEFDASKVSLPGWDIEAAIVTKLEERLGKLTEIAALLDPKLAERLAQQARAKADAPIATELFESLQAKVDFDSWPWRLENLSLGARGVSATGTGSFDPEAGAVNLTFTARLSREVTARLVEKHPAVRPLVGPSGQFALPLRIQGPMMKPSIGVVLEGLAAEALGKESLEQAAKDLVKEKVRDAGEQARDAAKEKARDAAKDALRGLLDKQRDKRQPTPTPTPAPVAEDAPAATPTPIPTPQPTPTPEDGGSDR